MPAVRITDRSAASFKWIGRPEFRWDIELKGFGVWIMSEHRRTYVIQVKHGHRSYRETLGKVGEISQEEAREQAAAFKRIVNSAHDPNATKTAESDAWMLQDAMDHFLGAYATRRRLNPVYCADCDALFKHHTPDEWKSMKLADVSRSMIVARHIAIAGGIIGRDNRTRGGSRRADAWLALMSRLFTLSIPNGHCTTNPTTGIRRMTRSGVA